MRRITINLMLFLVLSGCNSNESLNESYTLEAIDLSLSGQSDWQMSDSLVNLINSHRASNNLNALIMDKTYVSAHSVKHCIYMIHKGRISHYNFSTRSSDLKARGAIAVAENVAQGYSHVSEVMEACLNSPDHRTLIEGSYTHTGIGIILDNRGTRYYTQIFYR